MDEVEMQEVAVRMGAMMIDVCSTSAGHDGEGRSNDERGRLCKKKKKSLGK